MSWFTIFQKHFHSETPFCFLFEASIKKKKKKERKKDKERKLIIIELTVYILTMRFEPGKYIFNSGKNSSINLITKSKALRSDSNFLLIEIRN